MHAPLPTIRLLRAALAERDEIARHRARMAEEADELRRALTRIERGLLELDERAAMLDRLAPPETVAARLGGDARGSAETHEAGSGEAGTGGTGTGTGAGVRGEAGPGGGDSRGGERDVLRGPAIREVAVRVLLERGGGPIHYRDWFALLEERGHRIAGKDPLAVFLTQLSRSPAVTRATTSGTYELDRHAGARHRTRLDSLQRDLRELTVQPHEDRIALRRRREALTADIGRAERALEEVERLLGPGPALRAVSNPP